MELVQAPLQVPERIDHTERPDQGRRGRAGPGNRRVAFARARKREKAEWEHRARRKGNARAPGTDENDKGHAVLRDASPRGCHDSAGQGTRRHQRDHPGGRYPRHGGNPGRRISPGHTRRRAHPAGNRGIHRRQAQMGFPDDRQGKPAVPAEGSIRQDTPAARRNPARRHGGTRPRPDQKTVLLDRQRRRNRLLPHARQAAIIRREIFEISVGRISKSMLSSSPAGKQKR